MMVDGWSRILIPLVASFAFAVDDALAAITRRLSQLSGGAMIA